MQLHENLDYEMEPRVMEDPAVNEVVMKGLARLEELWSAQRRELNTYRNVNVCEYHSFVLPEIAYTSHRVTYSSHYSPISTEQSQSFPACINASTSKSNKMEYHYHQLAPNAISTAWFIALLAFTFDQ